MKRKTNTFDISNAIRKDIYVSPSGNKQTIYIFNCLNCNNEFSKTAYYAKNCTGLCKTCAPKQVNIKEKIKLIEKSCKYCKNIKPISKFRIRENGHYRNECIDCINLKTNFNLDSNNFEEILKSQNGVCAICKKPETAKHQNGKIRKLAVDHCHKTGIIRGLLCTNCNTGLGAFKDDLNLLNKSIEYLEKFNETKV